MRVTRSRWLAALVTLAYAWGYLMLFTHYVTEQHGECLEHGGQHHVVESDRHDALPAQGISGLGDVEDDHCELSEVVRDTATFQFADPVVATVDLVELPEFVVPLGLAPGSRGAVWRYAPKTSPPTVLG